MGETYRVQSLLRRLGERRRGFLGADISFYFFVSGQRRWGMGRGYLSLQLPGWPMVPMQRIIMFVVREVLAQKEPPLAGQVIEVLRGILGGVSQVAREEGRGEGSGHGGGRWIRRRRGD